MFFIYRCRRKHHYRWDMTEDDWPEIDSRSHKSQKWTGRGLWPSSRSRRWRLLLNRWYLISSTSLWALLNAPGNVMSWYLLFITRLWAHSWVVASWSCSKHKCSRLSRVSFRSTAHSRHFLWTFESYLLCQAHAAFLGARRTSYHCPTRA